ncbi:RusA family crossover junction endodeoxyribonuclease [Prosthecomicrobium hirschii]|uniref:RusA family crossover junction endodeoxyribonuclease n=1 Tax=Prosthecodimorpha hirschii TaxID=665126 RepID=UPI00112BA42C|nr:RusA family crossover junction endodeoxyribonuclease [Prosthecomicrobium hirschii]MCW1840414.1 RusA family crossover junction endodeoxyribonuclease [Prosthecomicrobium hirschii]
MSVEISFPFEFVVLGVPVSLQNKGRSKEEWIQKIRNSIRQLTPEAHWLYMDSIFVEILYFPRAVMQGDVDNIVKPILDAMATVVFSDDRQVERVIVQKFEPHRQLEFDDPSVALARAVDADEPTLYVRVDDDYSARRLWL